MNQSGFADLKNSSIVNADEIVIGVLVLPNLDPNSVPYIASDNSVQDLILNNGQVLVGVNSGPPVAASLTGTTDEVIVTNGPGSITLSTPQPIATTSSPVFSNIKINGDVSGPTYVRKSDNIISCSTPQTTDNLVSFSGSQKVIQDSGISASTGPWLPLAGGTMSGSIAMGTNNITNVGNLSGATNSRTADNIVSNTGSGTLNNLVSFVSDKVVKDSGISASSGPWLPLAGGTMSGDINMGVNNLTNVNNILTTFSTVTIGKSNINPSTNSICVGANNTIPVPIGGLSIVYGNGNNMSSSINGQNIIYGYNNSDSNSSGGSFIYGFGNTNGTGSRNMMFGRDNTIPNGVNDALVIGFNGTNSTSNSILFQNATANIRPGTSNTCDLGTTASRFKDIQLSGSVVGSVNTRAANDIVSNTGASTSGNLCSFSGTSGKVITDSALLATNIVTNTGGTVTSGQVVTFSGTTGRLITNSTTPILGTPASGTLTSCTGLPISTGVSGLGTGVATMLGTFSSANIASACTDETGTGSLVFSTNPNFTGPTARSQPLKLSRATQYEAFSISNTITATSYFDANSVGSLVYPANTTNLGMVIKIRAIAQLNNWAGGGTLAIHFYQNSASVFSVSVPAATAIGSYISTDFEYVLRSGTLSRGQCILNANGQFPVLSDSGGTWDKTVSNTIDVRVKWSVASGVNIISPLLCTIETHYQT